MKSNIKYEIPNNDQKIKYLDECLNSVKETGKAKEMLQKLVIFLKNELIRNAEIIKILLETQTFILEQHQSHH